MRNWSRCRNCNCRRDYSIAHRLGYCFLRNDLKCDFFGGEFMYGYGTGVAGYAGAGVIVIAVLILIALGVIF